MHMRYVSLRLFKYFSWALHSPDWPQLTAFLLSSNDKITGMCSMANYFMFIITIWICLTFSLTCKVMSFIVEFSYLYLWICPLTPPCWLSFTPTQHHPPILHSWYMYSKFSLLLGAVYGFFPGALLSDWLIFPFPGFLFVSSFLVSGSLLSSPQM